MLSPSKEETLRLWEYSFPPGWLPLVKVILDRMDAVQTLIFVSQIKEKFGTLRCYYDIISEQDFPEDEKDPIYKDLDRLQYFVWDMESFSALVCQDCGATATTKLRELSWVRALCDDCVKSYSS